MALFQQSVITKHLDSLDKKHIDQKWGEFSAHFGNIAIQNQIRSLKEEQYQGEFLEDLFVKILGYTKAPQPNHNLITEQKNETNSKKADGAILITGSNGLPTVRAVIELKGTDTTDLGKIETQAFGYKNNQTECVYVVTSNFEKLRFYIDNAVDFIEFNLFTLTKEEFQLLYICLSFENIKNNIPKHLKDESVSKENQITKKLYKDYSEFKRALYNNLVERNPQIDKLVIFKKTQKLLDRFLFIFFAEDRQLVPTNLIRRINLEWENLKKARMQVSLYDRYKMYFDDLNTGAKVTLPAFGKKTGDAITAEFEIFAYNGGLFQPDEILDNVQIDDDILHKHSIILSDYDFDSDVDVNILGHIFENSLNEIDEIKSEIAGAEIDKTKTKRKKDGVFYTPKYITKYIVDNTIGKLCEEKKSEFEIIDEEFAKGRKNRNKTTIQKLDKSLHDYRDWLLQITICDPACGSGAFLNQALEFLIQEHKYIDELESQLIGTSIGFPGAELHILENNIYGVDLNEESVEIAKLSLWLRTAQKGRKLNSLNNNIKCGNSLIDDVSVAGDKAFSWEKEFSEVFEKGGFDVIIGNPPYVRQELFKEYSKYLEQNYASFSGKADLFIYFYEKSTLIAKNDGFISFISSGKFFEANYGKPLITFLVKKTKFIEVIDFKDLNIFDGISAYPLILSLRNSEQEKKYNFHYQDATKINVKYLEEITQKLDFETIEINEFKNNDFKFLDNSISKLIKKVEKDSVKLENLKLSPLVGVKTGFNSGFLVKNTNYSKDYVFGRDVKKYGYLQTSNKIFFPYHFTNDKYELISDTDTDLIYLEVEKENLKNRAIIKEGLINGTKKWFEFQQINRKLNFNDEFIIYPNVSLGNNFTLSKGNVIDMTGFIIPSNSKYLLTILNSKLVEYLMSLYAISRRGGYLEYKVQYISKLPIKNIPKQNETPFIVKADIMLTLNKEFQSLCQKFSSYFSKQYKIEKLSGKLEKWYELEFTDFIKELNKSIKIVGGTPLTKKDEFEWMDLFEENKKKALELKTEIDKTDKEIDQMVYELYGLTEEEIKIVEGN